MVYRIFVEKKPGQTHEADKLLKDVQEFLQISALESVRVINRYDVENIDEALFENAVRNVFSEPQVVLPLLESDLLTIMLSCTNGTLDCTEVKFADKHACCVITASEGYPESYKKGFPLVMTEEAAACSFVAGAKMAAGVLVTTGGRVTGTTAIAASLPEAIQEAYRLADGVKFDNAYRRSDIGQRALQALK